MKNKHLLIVFLFFSAGIIFSRFIHFILFKKIFIHITFLNIIFYFYLSYTKSSIKKLFIPLLLIQIFCFAVLYTNFLSRGGLPSSCLPLKKTPYNLTGIIDQPVEEYGDKSILSLKIEKIADSNNVAFPYEKRVKVTIYDSDMKELFYGDRIRLKARLTMPKGYSNPGNFDYKNYLLRRHIYLKGSVSKKLATEIHILEKNSLNKVFHSIYTLRRSIDSLASTYIDCPDSYALFCALVLGDKSKIGHTLNSLFRYSGSSHILSISGLHIGFITIFLFSLLWVFKRSIPPCLHKENDKLYILYRVCDLLTIIPILFYVFITGVKISTIRASIMFILYLIALSIDREQDLYTTLTWAAFIILLWKPFSLFEPGFQLTFMATFSIIFYLHHRPQFLRKNSIEIKILNLLCISTCALYFISPLTAFHFQHISPGGIFIAPLLIPFLSLIIPAGILSAALFPCSTSISIILIKFCGTILKALLKVLTYSTTLPYLSFNVSIPGILLIVLFYCVIMLILFKYHPFSHTSILLSLCTFALFIFINEHTLIKSRADEMKIYHLDVGKGDASLIQITSLATTILIDGGGIYENKFDIGHLVLRPFLHYRHVKKIDIIVLSHPHPDHINGLFDIIKSFKIKEIWIAPQTGTNSAYKNLKILIKKYDIKERIISAGDKIYLSPCISVHILHPNSEKIARPRSDNSYVNNHSVVLRLHMNHMTFLYTGDIEKEAEKELVSKYKYNGSLSSTCIKIPHHGSRYSSTREFLQTVSPQIAIISTRKTSWYQMPSHETLERLSHLNIATYRTDMDGCIRIITDGKNYRVSTWNTSRNNLLFANYLWRW
ncbi:MAG: DNA internalization-related competence protein ComEC/Rec2 [bacterium]